MDVRKSCWQWIQIRLLVQIVYLAMYLNHADELADVLTDISEISLSQEMMAASRQLYQYSLLCLVLMTIPL